MSSSIASLCKCLLKCLMSNLETGPLSAHAAPGAVEGRGSSPVARGLRGVAGWVGGSACDTLRVVGGDDRLFITGEMVSLLILTGLDCDLKETPDISSDLTLLTDAEMVRVTVGVLTSLTGTSILDFFDLEV